MGHYEQVIEMDGQDKIAAQNFLKEMEIDVMARTIWGEARNQNKKGMEAVTHVILNRVKHAKQNGDKFWWGHDIITVCQKPYQFSCWNPGDPNRKKLMAVDKNNVDFLTCLQIAKNAVNGILGEDITGGSDHYHTKEIEPYWSKKEKIIKEIGDHLFYKLEG